MKMKKPILDSLSFEVRYAYGSLYLDRCGQTMVDIEKRFAGWITGPADPNSATMENFEDNFKVQFNSNKYNFFATKPSSQSIEYIAETAAKIWKVILANLNLEEFPRIGCRAQYLLATKSIEAANNLIKKSSLKIEIPSQITEDGFSLKSNKVDVVFINDEIEYQVKLEPIIRSESVNPSALVSVEPRSLPKNQQEALLNKLKGLNDYSVNPMYAVQLDVDCSQYHPESFSVEEYINGRHKVVCDKFYFLLEELWRS